MVLAIDIGNTNIVAGCFDGDKITFIERLSTNQNSTELEYAMLIKNVLEINEIDSKNIEGSIISSVVPNVTQTLNNAIEKITGKQPIIVGPGIKTGVSIKIDNPAQLGSDILVGAVAGIAEYNTPLVIIDMGTATTISVINNEPDSVILGDSFGSTSTTSTSSSNKRDNNSDSLSGCIVGLNMYLKNGS